MFDIAVQREASDLLRHGKISETVALMKETRDKALHDVPEPGWHYTNEAILESAFLRLVRGACGKRKEDIEAMQAVHKMAHYLRDTPGMLSQATCKQLAEIWTAHQQHTCSWFLAHDLSWLMALMASLTHGRVAKWQGHGCVSKQMI